MGNHYRGYQGGYLEFRQWRICQTFQGSGSTFFCGRLSKFWPLVLGRPYNDRHPKRDHVVNNTPYPWISAIPNFHGVAILFSIGFSLVPLHPKPYIFP